MSNRLKLASLLLTALFAGSSCLAVKAQYNYAGASTTSLRTPLINGATSAYPNVQAAQGQAPAMGDGSLPAPVVPGHLGPPTLLPSVNHTDGGISGGSYNTYLNPASVAMPGQLGPSMYAPPSPSTPGWAPGIVHGPRDFYPPPVTVTNVMPGGGLAGYAPTSRWGGQTSTDFGRYKYRGTRSFDFGQGMYGQTAQDGPQQTFPNAVPTQDQYGNRMSPKNGMGVMTIAPF
ncbi:MAG: hypothetical protein K2W82_07165 [Candidatus Obscuribacterales bacterium]|nr:hypothetical protein [Candidatus Obscuribacterales bacterium]